MGFEGWRDLKLNDICEITSSKRIYAKEYRPSGIPFYRGKEIIEKFKGNNVSTELFISNKRFIELIDKFGAPIEGDILLSSVGTLGVPYLVQNECFYFKDGNLTWFRKFKDSYSKFIFLWLQSIYAKNQINSKAIGSTQKALTIDVLKKFEINLPPLPEQKAIAATLTCLDDKIELNNHINKNLEEMAQAIFKYWFVDFEFPNENDQPYKLSGGEMVDSELGLIPEGWRVGTLNEVTSKFATGLNPRKNFVLGNGNNYYVTIKNMQDNQIWLDEKCDKITDEAIVKINNRSNLVEGDLLFSGIGTIGRVFLIDSTPQNWNISESVFTLRSNELLSSEILYMILLSESMQNYAHKLASGSVQKGIRMADLKKYKILIPPIVIIKRITHILIALIKQIKLNQSQNIHLKTIRDTLLPKLMSGEIRVPYEEVV